MTEAELKKEIGRLLKKIAPDADIDQLKPDENIRETLQIDSFDFLQFVISLDKTLKIKIPEEDYGKIRTLSELINYLKNVLARN